MLGFLSISQNTDSLLFTVCNVAFLWTAREISKYQVLFCCFFCFVLSKFFIYYFFCSFFFYIFLNWSSVSCVYVCDTWVT